jgi:hypothetical protein
MATRKDTAPAQRNTANEAAYDPADDAAAIDAMHGAGLAVEVVNDGTLVAVPQSFDEDALRVIDNFDAAVALTKSVHGELAYADQELGDGFALLDKDSKGRLEGVPLLLMEWSFYPGDYGDEFAAIRVISRNQDGSVGKFILNDGSKGIRDSLRRYTERTGRVGGLLVKNGLRKSDYLYCDMCRMAADNCQAPDVHKDSKEKLWRPATTFYLDTSA